MSLLYNTLYLILLIISIPFLAFSIKRKGYRFDLKERFVLYNDEKKDGYIWFHCASVGELKTAEPLINYFKDKFNILITVSSPRGKDFALENFSYATVRTLPFDLPFLIRKFLKLYNPKILIITEGEFYYNLICISSKKIPVVSINTRISPSSYRIYKKFSFLFSKILSCFSKMIVRSEKDFKYLKKFIIEDKLVLCGDLKFLSSSNVRDVFLNTKNKKIILAGSTHDPEEKVLITVFKSLRLRYPDVRLVIAPRHLERIPEIKKLIKEEGLSYSLRSETEVIEKDVYIVDTMGELSGMYKYADVVFVGGTISNVGGHNIIEPILNKKPVIIGNNYEKIKDLYNFFEKYNMVYSVNNGRELEKIIEDMLLTEFKPEIDISDLQEKIFNCYLRNIEEFINE
ncbi:3-deoxy-D-manno-octulosonic acid transferase [Persephonella sp.]